MRYLIFLILFNHLLLGQNQIPSSNPYLAFLKSKPNYASFKEYIILDVTEKVLISEEIWGKYNHISHWYGEYGEDQKYTMMDIYDVNHLDQVIHTEIEKGSDPIWLKAIYTDSTKNVFDKRGKLISWSKYDSTKKILVQFDSSSGILLERRTKFENGIQTCEQKNKDRIIQKEILYISNYANTELVDSSALFNGADYLIRKSYIAYDSLNNIISIVRRDFEMRGFNEERISIKYKYDKNGNWIEREERIENIYYKKSIASAPAKIKRFFRKYQY